jgi:N-acyl-D-amino-acid deacylase
MGNPFRIALICLLATTAPLAASDYDLVIRNGLIADGTGNPAYHSDIGIKDGRIAFIGRIPAGSTNALDASGLVVAPGFIDVHTHADSVAGSPRAENFARMGVTTIIAGNCGGSTLDVGEWCEKIESAGISVNAATLIGHNTVRREAMGGNFMRAPTDEELARMKSLVEEAMQDGAVGLSTGLIYLPGTFSKTEEIIALAKVASQFDGIYVSHMRNEGTGIFEAINELIRIAREARIRAEISHIKLSGNAAWGQTDKVLGLIERARAEGLDITQDQYAYTASSTGISQLIPEEAREGGRDDFKKRIDDPEQKAGIVAKMKENLARNHRTNYAYAVIADYRHDRSLNGMNIVEAAKKVRGNDSLADQIEMILEIQTNGGASGVFHGMTEEDLQSFMRHPNTMVACDSAIRDFGEGVPHPRGYGNNARVLARYVRELRVLRLEDAVRKMTSLPATTFRLKDRGLIREGAWADFALFDPSTVRDAATFTDPHHYPEGIPHVLVNGQFVIRDGEHTDARPGHALRHQSLSP